MAVTIRRFQKEDIPAKIRWINDGRNNQYLHYDLPLEYEKTLRWYEQIKIRPDRYDAVMEWNGIPVGILGLLHISNRQAEYYITLGEEAYGGKGIAGKATGLLLEYGFSKLALSRIYLYTETGNIKGQRLFERSGFRRTGLEKNAVKNRGKWADCYIYEIKAADFYQTGQPETADYETPLYRIQKGKNQIFIKRDDLLPVSFGGNKARKARYFFQEIDAGNYDGIVTYGSSTSNHCRVIANMAACRNLPCTIISPREPAEPFGNTKQEAGEGKSQSQRVSFNRRLMKQFGAKILSAPVEQVSAVIDQVLQEGKEFGGNPYFIGGGGHGPLGTQAYVDCYEEIRRYEIRRSIHFDYIFLASGTGTTQAGLVCGQLLHGEKRKIIGVSIARQNPRGRQAVLDSIHEYLTEKNIACTEEAIEEMTVFEDSYVKGGYGKKAEDVLDTIREMMRRYGIPMDATYTAKAYRGMQEYLEKQGITGKRVLFLHTGGTPLFFDELAEKYTL